MHSLHKFIELREKYGSFGPYLPDALPDPIGPGMRADRRFPCDQPVLPMIRVTAYICGDCMAAGLPFGYIMFQ